MVIDPLRYFPHCPPEAAHTRCSTLTASWESVGYHRLTATESQRWALSRGHSYVRHRETFADTVHESRCAISMANRLGYTVSQSIVEVGVSANDVVHARIDGQIKREATAVPAQIGLTPSDAFRMLMVRTVAEQALAFNPLVPNAATAAAMLEADEGALPRAGTVSDLMNDLHADD